MRNLRERAHPLCSTENVADPSTDVIPTLDFVSFPDFAPLTLRFSPRNTPATGLARYLRKFSLEVSRTIVYRMHSGTRSSAG